MIWLAADCGSDIIPILFDSAKNFAYKPKFCAANRFFSCESEKHKNWRKKPDESNYNTLLLIGNVEGYGVEMNGTNFICILITNVFATCHLII